MRSELLVRVTETLVEVIEPPVEAVPIGGVAVKPFCLEIDLIRALHFIARRLEISKLSPQAVETAPEPLPVLNVVRIESDEIPLDQRFNFATCKELRLAGIGKFACRPICGLRTKIEGGAKIGRAHV